MEAGLEVGDIVLGAGDETFRSADEIREWTMTSKPDVPLELHVLRPARSPGEDRELTARVRLRPFPSQGPIAPEPPQVGENAPSLPLLETLGEGALPEMRGREHLLFFWATWCQPCKAAIPEILAFAADRGLPVIAITAEPPADVERYLQKRGEPFFAHVAIDRLDSAFDSYRVEATPTLLWVDANGVVRHMQVGYDKKKGLRVPEWKWKDAPAPADESTSGAGAATSWPPVPR
jgi:thiol-disulfide isomerase/thioredoxin